jgi:hypothetical protein
MKARYLIIGLLSLLAGPLSAQTAPYPTAGGAGGAVVTVTSLEDSGPGTLREALDRAEPRVIRFAVGGEIMLKDSLHIRQPFVTVEGESAPSPGITIMGDRLRVRSHDVILRHIRVRVGALLTASDPQNRDGIQIDGAQDGSDPGYNVLVENCSVSWAIDENVQIWGKNNHDIVVRDCILAEGLAKSIHPKGGTHSAGLVVGPGIKNVLVQGNLFASNAFRNPVGSAGSSIVVINNLIANPGFNAFHLYGREGDVVALATVIGNVVVAGKSTSKKMGIFHKNGLNPGSQVYLKDNTAEGTETFDLTSRPSNWPADGPSPFVDTPPVPVPDGVKILPSAEVEASVLARAGARPNDRDEVDKRLIEEVKARSGTIKDFPTDPRLLPRKAVLPGVMGEYAALLEKYVTPKGIRYAEWKKSAEDLAVLKKVVDDIAVSKEDDLAFYLNAYNAWMLHEVLAAYPLKSINDLAPKFLEEKRLKVAGKETSFKDLEALIDSRFHDPRTIFALNRASKGAPRPIAQPFVTGTLTTQLDELTGKFVNSGLAVQVKEQEIFVSALFDWKKEQLPRGTENTINTYRNSHVPKEPKISFQKYDWALNEVQ